MSKEFIQVKMDGEGNTPIYTKQTNMYLSNDNANGQFAERAKWSDEDIETLFDWFKDIKNVQLYSFGVKAKAIRNLAEVLPTKSSRQIYNKMNSLESQYQATKERLKQGIPLTDRDYSQGINTAQAKVKSIFRYYYEMDRIISLQNSDKEHSKPTGLDEGSYSASPGDVSYQNDPTESYNNELDHKNTYSGQRADIQSESYSRNYEDNVGSSPSAKAVEGEKVLSFKKESVESNTPQSHFTTGRRRGRRPQNQGNINYLSNTQEFTPVMNVQNYNNNQPEKRSKHENLSKYAEKKLTQRKEFHEDFMKLAKQQLEAEAESRRFAHQEHLEWVAIKKLELENKRAELIIERIKLEKQYNITLPINLPPVENSLPAPAQPFTNDNITTQNTGNNGEQYSASKDMNSYWD